VIAIVADVDRRSGGGGGGGGGGGDLYVFPPVLT